MFILNHIVYKKHFRHRELLLSVLGMVETLSKLKLPDAIQGPILRSALSKDSGQDCYVNSFLRGLEIKRLEI